jgi:tetratricopeptide (TPR) repeat protein
MVFGLFCWVLFLAKGAEAKPAVWIAADHYFKQQDYRQAFPLWQRVLKEDPENPIAVAHVAELTLWFQGRSGVPDLFLGVLEKSKLSRPQQNQLKQKYWDLQTGFLSDAAQNLYWQAKHRIARGDLPGALRALEGASDKEPGQFLILRQKAGVERRLGAVDAYFQTLRQVFRSYPYDPATRLDWVEALLYQKQYAALLQALEREGPLTPSYEALRLIALVDSGDWSSALHPLRTLSKTSSKLSPVLYYALADAIRQTGNSAECRRWYEKFLSKVVVPEGEAVWEPYRIAERVAEARRYLAVFRQEQSVNFSSPR